MENVTQDEKEAIDKAFLHIRKHLPEVDTIIFFENGTWLCTNSETHECQAFPDEINVSLLEDAIPYSLPAIFEYP